MQQQFGVFAPHNPPWTVGRWFRVGASETAGWLQKAQAGKEAAFHKEVADRGFLVSSQKGLGKVAGLPNQFGVVGVVLRQGSSRRRRRVIDGGRSVQRRRMGRRFCGRWFLAMVMMLVLELLFDILNVILTPVHTRIGRNGRQTGPWLDFWWVAFRCGHSFENFLQFAADVLRVANAPCEAIYFRSRDPSCTLVLLNAIEQY